LTDAIPFYLHDLGEAELDAVRAVLATPILTTGDTVNEFQQRFAAYLGRRHAIGLSSATGAIHLALTALGVGPGDEVITTPMSFVATATAILQAGAVPVFVDIEADTGNMDVTLVEAAITPRTRAILPVHLYGQMVDMRPLRALADRHGLAIVEDAAHCVEGERDGVRPGMLSEAACFSFYATKNLNCGEGGALVTDDAERAGLIRRLATHGVTKTAADRAKEGYRHWDMDVFGWKYNMSNIQAAFLLPQFLRLERKVADRQALAERYCRGLASVPGIMVPAQRPRSQSAWHLFVIRSLELDRDTLLARLQQAGCGVVVNYLPIHLTAYFRERFGYRPGDFPLAEQWGDSVLSLPFWPGMGMDRVDRVVDQVRAAVAGASRT
jgi:dTDP-4-amino-4,6-dideoxygalactose transaminase